MTYRIIIKETFSKEVTTDADSQACAEKRIKEQYKSGEIHFTQEDLTEINYSDAVYVSSCVPEENLKRKDNEMSGEIREKIKSKIRSQIEDVVDNYDFSWAIDDAMDSADYKDDIEEAIFDHLSDNLNDYIGSIVEETISEEVPGQVDAVFEQ